MNYTVTLSQEHFGIIWGLLSKTAGLTAETTFPVMDSLKRQVEDQERTTKESADKAESERFDAAVKQALAARAVGRAPSQ